MSVSGLFNLSLTDFICCVSHCSFAPLSLDLFFVILPPSPSSSTDTSQLLISTAVCQTITEVNEKGNRAEALHTLFPSYPSSAPHFHHLDLRERAIRTVTDDYANQSRTEIDRCACVCVRAHGFIHKEPLLQPSSRSLIHG